MCEWGGRNAYRGVHVQFLSGKAGFVAYSLFLSVKFLNLLFSTLSHFENGRGVIPRLYKRLTVSSYITRAFSREHQTARAF